MHIPSISTLLVQSLLTFTGVVNNQTQTENLDKGDMTLGSITKASPAAYLAAIQGRRSIYAINNVLPQGVSQETIQKVVEDATLQTPTTFNSQSGRAVVLFGSQHDKLWKFVWTALAKKGFQDEETKNATKSKVDSFGAGAGTILFFEDQQSVHNMEDRFPAYAANFPIWSDQSSGILQGNVWTSLSTYNVGASLQHYTNLISENVTAEWSLPESWLLKSQMPFGGIVAPAKTKTFAPIEDRVKVFGKTE
ncbi:Nitroreductase-like [Phaffia rhodozyma]|uniref:Nitroreductase-like n=1 Tax=Phaffia rhodozyma TaxID=264483 RepID=A0A0F7STM9_PHARH|nr:Nitroreductase-like [Phaffia rhodozyma]